ncbi:MAG: gamma-glutamylcyclotransferase [Deltaproteobacteria bacterium]|nr:gamma-glutamylcyclotransferase [Deltaproteobacteria bacterium]
MPETELIFFYGTLMLPYPTLEHLGVENMLVYQGWDRVSGRLYSLGRYPALTLEPGSVRGQVFEMSDPKAMAVLDGFEHFFPGDPDNSEYLRKLIPLTGREASAWVYVFNRSTEGLTLIPGGDWAAHQGPALEWDDFFDSRTVE